MREDLSLLSLDELRMYWAEAWGNEPHVNVGRKMLEYSLGCKQNAKALTDEQQKHLDNLVKEYKKNKNYFEGQKYKLKVGTKIERIYKGSKRIVTVLDHGFEYDSIKYKTLSQIAYKITSTKWNGWLFFGIKN